MKIHKFDESKMVQIVRDGAIAHPDWGDGRIIPALILDCNVHKQLLELILVQQILPPVTW
jgi:hypothetical protein